MLIWGRVRVRSALVSALCNSFSALSSKNGAVLTALSVWEEAWGSGKLQGSAFFGAAHPLVSQWMVRKHETKQCIQILICLKGAMLHLHFCRGPIKDTQTLRAVTINKAAFIELLRFLVWKSDWQHVLWQDYTFEVPSFQLSATASQLSVWSPAKMARC